MRSVGPGLEPREGELRRVTEEDNNYKREKRHDVPGKGKGRGSADCCGTNPAHGLGLIVPTLYSWGVPC